MTPEEKFNKDTWYVLQNIKKKSLYAEDDKSISYEISFNVIASGLPLAEEEIAILKKLQQWQAIKILSTEDVFDYTPESGTIYFLEILRPKFDELYRLYEQKTNPIPIKNPDDLKTQVKIIQLEKRINKELKELTNANKKKLYVLEKLKEGWDLLPEKDRGVTPIRISYQKVYKWENESGIDYNQLKNILQGFKEEGLLEEFKLYNPAI